MTAWAYAAAGTATHSARSIGTFELARILHLAIHLVLRVGSMSGGSPLAPIVVALRLSGLVADLLRCVVLMNDATRRDYYGFFTCDVYVAALRVSRTEREFVDKPAQRISRRPPGRSEVELDHRPSAHSASSGTKR
jgi:hypothetical protein